MSRVATALLAALLLAPSADAQTADQAQVPADADLLLLQVVVNAQPVSEVLSAYQSGDEILLPLGELARLLTLAITTQPEKRSASGYVLREDRTFSLDLAQATVLVDGRSEAVDPRKIDVQANDIYVSSRLLARWLPVDLDVDMSGLQLLVRTRERLPMQFRLEREAQAARLGQRNAEIDPAYPRHEIPYRMLDWPFIDQTLSVDYLRNDAREEFRSRYSLYATADLLGLQSALYVAAGSGSESTDTRLTLGRNDPDAGLLGPLQARTALIGSIPVPAEANISRTSALGEGAVISNRPLSQPTSFGQHSLLGPLPPGWDVELYFNDVLIGFQTAGPDGQYRFDDQPLVFGPNEFRLVFHGPLGQVRVERESFLLDESVTSPGEFYYSLAQQRDTQGQQRTVARFDWGLGEHFAATGGFVRAPVAGMSENFAHLGLQSYWRSMLFSGELVRSQEGSLASLALRTRLGKWSLKLGQVQLWDFSSEVFPASNDPLRFSTEFRADGSLSLPRSAIRLPVTVEARREQRASGSADLDVAARTSVLARDTLASAQLRWQRIAEQDFADTTLQLSRRVRGVSVRGQLNYTIAPQSRLAAVALSADKRLGKGYLQSLSVTRIFGSSETLYATGLTKTLGSFGLGVTAGYSSSGNITAGLQFFLAAGREPRGSRWRFDAQPGANSGGASALVFLDDNMNGRMDAGEQPVEGVGFTVNGGRYPVQTDASGVAYLARLPAMQYTDIAVVTESLEDPNWQPQTRGLRIVPRPGTVAKIEIPVAATSEIDGTVHLLENERRIGAGSLAIEVVAPDGRIVATGSTGADGYYVVAGVPAGDYLVRVSAEQLRRLGLQDAATHAVTVSRDGWLVSGIDIELTR